MGHTWLCFSLVSPLTLLPGSHTGGIWNLLAAESHRAIKPSKAHKRTRGRTSNNVGPTGCQQTQCILNLNKPQCSFFILSVSVNVSLNYSSLSLPPLTNTTWEWVEGEFYIFTPTWNWYWCWGSLMQLRRLRPWRNRYWWGQKVAVKITRHRHTTLQCI